MIAEHTKLLSQERRKAAASMQSVTDKMSRLTNRKSSLQKPCLVNEYGSGGDRGEKVVTFNNSSNKSNQATARYMSSNEGKRIILKNPIITVKHKQASINKLTIIRDFCSHSRVSCTVEKKLTNEYIQFNIGWSHTHTFIGITFLFLLHYDFDI
jgi:hypothetical protein